jgi:activator of HSP90 ATPase
MKTLFSVSTYLDVAPDVLYRAWLSSEEHAGFTGSAASIDPAIGGRFTAWDGYISGTTLEKEEGRRIVQSWRTTEFPEGSPDSRIELVFQGSDGGTRLTIDHSGVPEGQAEEYEHGWEEFYFEPMREYYSEG